MRKKALLLLSAVCVLATGCGNDIEEISVGEQKNEITLADYDYKDFITLGEYKGFKIPVSVQKVTDEEVDASLQSLVDAHAERVEKNGAAELSDYVSISYQLILDGSELDSYTTNEEFIRLGDGYKFPELDSALVGVLLGEVRDVAVSITEDFYDSDLAGKETICHVTVNGVYEMKVPAVTDAWIAEVSECTTVDEWKSSKKEELQQMYEENAKWEFEAAVQEKITENAVFAQFPQELIDYRIGVYMKEDKESAESVGMDLEDFILDYYGYQNMEDYKKDLTSYVTESIKSELVIAALQAAEKVKLDEEYRKEFITDCLGYYGCADEEELISLCGQEALDTACENACVWETIIGYSEMLKE